MQATFYKADSVSNPARSPRYIPRVDSAKVITHRVAGGWDWAVGGVHCCCGIESEADAIAAGESYLMANGWATDRGDAWLDADRIAARRNGGICATLRRLRKTHKNALHGMLIGRGSEAVASLNRMICGIDAISDEMKARINRLAAVGHKRGPSNE